MTPQRLKKRDNIGPVRELHNIPAVWGGRSKASGVEGIHAVTDINLMGARTALCGLVGRYLVDRLLTDDCNEFADVDAEHRCTACHAVWLASS